MSQLSHQTYMSEFGIWYFSTQLLVICWDPILSKALTMGMRNTRMNKAGLGLKRLYVLTEIRYIQRHLKLGRIVGDNKGVLKGSNFFKARKAERGMKNVFLKVAEAFRSWKMRKIWEYRFMGRDFSKSEGREAGDCGAYLRNMHFTSTLGLIHYRIH